MNGVMTRRAAVQGLLLAALLPKIARAAAETPPPLQLRRLAKDIFMHVSWVNYGGKGFVASNGLVVLVRDGAVLIDTPCNAAYTTALLERIRMPVLQVIFTHAHDDRTGGHPVTLARGIPSLAYVKSSAKMEALGLGVPTAVWDGLSHALTIGGRRFELFYPGGAHSFDNSVVYLPDRALLFGGCMVRAEAATNPSGIQFADVCHWPKALRALELRYPKARVVVPGHGEPGGFSLLRHTGRLVAPAFESRACS